MANDHLDQNRLVPPSVSGLDESRKLAAKRKRKNRWKSRVTSSVFIAIAMGVVSAAGFVGYTAYTEQQQVDTAERHRRAAEIQAENDRLDTDDIIAEVERGRWRGQAPLGYSDDDEFDIEIIEPRQP